MENQLNVSNNDFFCQTIVTSRYTRIKAIMLDRNIKTIQELANKCGVSRSLISLILHCHKEPSLVMKLKMAKILDCDSRIIFPNGGEDEKNR